MQSQQQGWANHPPQQRNTAPPHHPPQPSPSIRVNHIGDLYDVDVNDRSTIMGTGSFSKVVLANCRRTQQARAIKVMDKVKLEGRKAEMVAHEKEILRRMHHPHIVRLFDVLETDHQVFMVLEKMDTDLYEWIRLNRKLCQQDASKVCRALLSATKYLHDHMIVHRDIKPENILINSVDDVRLADFGLAKVLRGDNASLQQATPCGTSFYIAPEIIRAIEMNGVVPLRITSMDVKYLDMWSIGVVLYIMLAGTPPFMGQIRSKEERVALLQKIDRGVLFPDSKWAAISDDAKDLIDGLLTINPSKRLNAHQALLSRFITCHERQPTNSLPTPLIFQELGSREAVMKAMDPVHEYHNDIGQYHGEDQQERPPPIKKKDTGPVVLGAPGGKKGGKGKGKGAKGAPAAPSGGE
eukprot:TRINITY_DN11099_c0_g1_i2.p2 TRINITY_DN11099_c0_g1~~TRINITY_DN11099_c0_g1_i2.p2  ORF type:complete len:410 (+),score=152.32 TRINITY_DN11099_c0_g1_i2:1464-2693(+)